MPLNPPPASRPTLLAVPTSAIQFAPNDEPNTNWTWVQLAHGGNKTASVVQERDFETNSTGAGAPATSPSNQQSEEGDSEGNADLE